VTQAAWKQSWALASKTAVNRPATLTAVCFDALVDVSATTPIRPASPTAYTRISSSSFAPAQGASLGQWRGCAGVAAEVGAEGVIVRAHANRVFHLADLARVTREWMHADSIDAVLVSSDDLLFSIALRTNETGR
jgi:hypothetical protein